VRALDFLLGVVCALLVAVLLACVAALHYKGQWYVGLADARMRVGCADGSSPEGGAAGCPPGAEAECRFRDHLPLADLLPGAGAGWLAGPRACRWGPGAAACLRSPPADWGGADASRPRGAAGAAFAARRPAPPPTPSTRRRRRPAGAPAASRLSSPTPAC
jgi:hypothetical protein